MPKKRAAPSAPLPLPLPLPPAAGEKACLLPDQKKHAFPGQEKACLLPDQKKHAFEPRGTPCHCSPWLRWFSVINPCNIYLFNRNGVNTPIVRVYTVIRPRQKKRAFSGRRAGNYTKADPCL
jgi:hypothetical protein